MARKENGLLQNADMETMVTLVEEAACFPLGNIVACHSEASRE
jgi:hypothetical protein